MTNITPCADCVKNLGIYDFGNDCCLTRFVLSAPTKTHRNMNLAYVERHCGKVQAAIIRQIVEESWKAKRAEVLNFGKAKKS
jgi:hypothetical protein